MGEKCVRKETEKCAPTVHDFPNYLPSVFYHFLYCSFYFIKSFKATVSNFAANEIMQASFHKEQLFFQWLLINPTLITPSSHCWCFQFFFCQNREKNFKQNNCCSHLCHTVSVKAWKLAWVARLTLWKTWGGFSPSEDSSAIAKLVSDPILPTCTISLPPQKVSEASPRKD